ncbi:serine hydrolase domain-containing protein [Sediminicola luteus]|uniref:Serine hydrolase n=1 Tax=Sediminicola luteus TaxID=319238 RepID=A0A2A4G663_9FLAO|nr:serine hydrolase [Sediminicola luteus]PCE63923.1 serine hydrolase [Sediminicola luteus]
MKWIKRIFLALIVILAVVIYTQYPKLNIISGYTAKNMASTVFYAQRSAESVNQNDHQVPLIELGQAQVNADEKSASATVKGLLERTAVYRDGLGAALLVEGYDSEIWERKPIRRQRRSNFAYPYGDGAQIDTIFAHVDYDRIEKALDMVFAYPDSIRTRTALIIHKDQILAERYVDGFDKTTPILGWSMTKSVLATLYGILEKENGLDVQQKPDLALWQEDDRKHITYHDLLQMESGLAWDEDYSGISDVTKMLFLEIDMPSVAWNKKAMAQPGEIFNYSSGTSNLLSGLLRKQFNDHQSYLDFPYTHLIDRIGMHSMLLETDLNGNFVGSSYGWANTRDWGKFGLLYLHRGNWNGDQLFNPSWADYVATPNRKSNGKYGAHFWLNANGQYPDVPTDMYSANGYQGQHVFIIPSKELVVVRTGLAEDPDFNINGFLGEIVKAIQ